MATCIALHAGCGQTATPEPEGGGESQSWLAACVEDAQCDEEFACICGICTLPCTDRCSPSGLCETTFDYPGSERCVAEPSPPDAICVPECDSATDCPRSDEAVCADGRCEIVETPDEIVSFDGELGLYNDNFTANTNCDCAAIGGDCHTLYRGMVETIDGTVLGVRFQKAASSGSTAPSEPVQVWIVARVDAAPMTCEDAENEDNHSLFEGVWQDTVEFSASIDLAGVPDFESLPVGTEIRIGFVTGGGGNPDLRLFWMREELIFTVR